MRIPFEEPEFLKKSVDFAGDAWRRRFKAVKEHRNCELMVMPEKLGPAPENADPYERENLWQLDSALSFGAEKLHFIALWDRKSGDGRGGTGHMFETVRARSGQTHLIDITTVW